MSKRWEIRRVSTFERTFNKITKEMAQPVGIIMFGVDCKFKKEVREELFGKMQGFGCDFNQRPDCSVLSRAFHDFRVVAVMLNSEESASHRSRHELVELMRSAGAETIVGIYVKVNQRPIRPLTYSLEKAEFNKRVAAIEQSNPTADGLGYLIIVEEDG